MRILYLNNRGSRWIVVDETGRRERITLMTKSGRTITRAVNFWAAWGNYATANISYNGKRINVFPDTVLADEFECGDVK